MLVSIILASALLFPGKTLGTEQQGWDQPTPKLADSDASPGVAATPMELERLRRAWLSTGKQHDVLSRIVEVADTAIRGNLTFPERGGQHNQWYQCETCQRPLITTSATEHSCATCNKAYSGAPYDDVVFGRVHETNLKNAREAAWAFAITKDAKYAAFAGRVLVGYAERYAKYPFHDTAAGKKPVGLSGGHLFAQTLDEAFHLATDIAPAFDLVFPALDSSQRNFIREGLLRPMVKNISKYRVGISNWQTWHNAGLVWGGACLGEATWINQALSDKGNGFVSQMDESVNDDGMWYENSWAYHFYALNGLVAIAEGSRRLGMDLWTHPKFKKMFTLATDYTMADGSLPRFGDDLNSSASQAQGQLEAAFHAYQDPSIGALLSKNPILQSISLGRSEVKQSTNLKQKSRIFVASGHAILRTQGPAGLTAAFTFSPFGGFHGHFDKLSFVLFGHGVEIGVDPGRARSQAYDLPVHKNWYRATISHNAVVVDRRSQLGASAKLELFGANEKFAAVRARTDEAYPGVAHSRTLVMTPEYLLVFDDLKATDQAQHRFDWLYHNKGKSVWCGDAREDVRQMDFPGTEFIEGKKAGQSNNPLRLMFQGTGASTFMTVDAQPSTGVLTGDGVGASMDDRVSVAMVTRNGRGARFAAAIEPVAPTLAPTVEGVTMRETDGVVVITVKRASSSDTVTIENKQIRVRRGTEPVLELK